MGRGRIFDFWILIFDWGSGKRVSLLTSAATGFGGKGKEGAGPKAGERVESGLVEDGATLVEGESGEEGFNVVGHPEVVCERGEAEKGLEDELWDFHAFGVIGAVPQGI